MIGPCCVTLADCQDLGVYFTVLYQPTSQAAARSGLRQSLVGHERLWLVNLMGTKPAGVTPAEVARHQSYVHKLETFPTWNAAA
jgi:hypothetical protein